MNVASGVSLLGLRTGIISKIPQNNIGNFVKNRIRFYGVSDDFLVYDQTRDARLGLYYYENGAHPRKPAIVYDRMYASINKIGVTDFEESLYESTTCFHTSGIMLGLGEQCRKTAVEMIKRFKKQGTLISFDVNFRKNLWDGDTGRKCIEEILPYVDIFFCSEDTARLTFQKGGSLKDIMKQFAQEYHISVIASTQRVVHSPKLHSFGSIIYCAAEDQYYEEEPYRNIEVIDRIGSGDAYISGVLYGLLSDRKNYQRALEFGNAAGAAHNTVLGDLPFLDSQELASIIRDHKSAGNNAEMER